MTNRQQISGSAINYYGHAVFRLLLVALFLGACSKSSTETPTLAPIIQTTPTLTPAPTVTPLLATTKPPDEADGTDLILSPIEPPPDNPPTPVNAYFFLIDVSSSISEACSERKLVPLYLLTLLGNIDYSSSAAPLIGVGQFYSIYEPIQSLSNVNQTVNTDEWWRKIQGITTKSSSSESYDTDFVAGLTGAFDEFQNLDQLVNGKTLFIFSDGKFDIDVDRLSQETKDKLAELKSFSIETVFIPLCNTEGTQITHWHGFVTENVLDTVLAKNVEANRFAPMQTEELIQKLAQDYFFDYLPSDGEWMFADQTVGNDVTVPGPMEYFTTHFVTLSGKALNLFNQDGHKMIGFQPEVQSRANSPNGSGELSSAPAYWKGSISREDIEPPYRNCPSRSWTLGESANIVGDFGFYWTEFEYPSVEGDLKVVSSQKEPITTISNYSPVNVDVSLAFDETPESDWLNYRSCFQVRLLAEWKGNLAGTELVKIEDFSSSFIYQWSNVVLPGRQTWLLKSGEPVTFSIEMFYGDILVSQFNINPIKLKIDFYPILSRATKNSPDDSGIQQ